MSNREKAREIVEEFDKMFLNDLFGEEDNLKEDCIDKVENILNKEGGTK